MSSEGGRSVAMTVATAGLAALSLVFLSGLLLIGPDPPIIVLFVVSLVFAGLSATGRWYGYAAGLGLAIFALAMLSPFIAADITRPAAFSNYAITLSFLLSVAAVIPSSIQALIQSRRGVGEAGEEAIGSPWTVLAIILLGMGIGGLFTSYTSSIQFTQGGGLVGVFAEPAEVIEVTAGNYFFEPNMVTIPKGELVKIEVTNPADELHSFSVDELGIHKDLPAGTTTEIWVRAQEDVEIGETRLYCAVPGHADDGMVGTLEVSG